MVALANSGQGLADAGSHSKVGESSDRGDEECGGVHETVSVRGALGRDEEEDGEASHDEEDDPEVGVTPLGGHNGVLKVRGNRRDADIGLLESVKDAVVVERVHFCGLLEVVETSVSRVRREERNECLLYSWKGKEQLRRRLR